MKSPKSLTEINITNVIFPNTETRASGYLTCNTFNKLLLSHFRLCSMSSQSLYLNLDEPISTYIITKRNGASYNLPSFPTTTAGQVNHAVIDLTRQ